MPVLLSGREPHQIAGTYLLDGAAVALSPSQPSGDDQRLTERVCVPGGASGSKVTLAPTTRAGAGA